MGNRAPILVVGGVVAAFVVALTFFGSSGSQIGAETTPTTFADLEIPDPSTATPTTAVPRLATVRPEVVRVTDLSQPTVLGLGRIIAVVGSGNTGHELVVIDPATGDTMRTLLAEGAWDFALDSSGRVLSYVTHGDGGDSRWLVSIDDPGEAMSMSHGTESFVWSSDEPRTAAWLEASSDGWRVMLGELTDQGMGSVEQLGWADGPLVGLNSDGYFAKSSDSTNPRHGAVEFVSRDGEVGWRALADVYVPPRSGTRGLAGFLDTSTWRWNFGLTIDGIQPLSWAPGDAAGDPGFASFSPRGSRIAFIGGDDRRMGWVEVHSTAGLSAERIELPYRVWAVDWSSNGAYVVIPGTDDRGTHVVALLDARRTVGEEAYVYGIVFDDWVQFASVIDRVGLNLGGPDAY